MDSDEQSVKDFIHLCCNLSDYCAFLMPPKSILLFFKALHPLLLKSCDYDVRGLIENRSSLSWTTSKHPEPHHRASIPVL